MRRPTGGFLGALAARASYAALTRRPPYRKDAWRRTNHRGEAVTLLEGPAFASGAVAGGVLTPGTPARLKAAVALAGLGTGALGAYDDLAGSGASRGFKGHLSALARGEVTSGAVKLIGIGLTGLGAAAIAGRELRPGDQRYRALDVAIDGALIAGCANLLNLFDLRPGRAFKVGLLAGSPLAIRGGAGAAVVAAPLGASIALLPEDLGERGMLGDAGANALGALLGLGAATLGRRTRLAVLAGVTALTLTSEKVSFTKVIAATPALRWLDELGRRAPATQPPAAAPEPKLPPAPESAPEPVAAPGPAADREEIPVSGVASERDHQTSEHRAHGADE